MKTPFHILIIEDNPDDRADIRQMLLRGSDVHYRFTEASTGAEGLRACREVGDAAPDLVLLDFHLPDSDAKLILAELRGDAALTPFPVVVLTGSETISGPEVLRAGAQDYIGKSWATAESLTHTIENAVERFRLLIDCGHLDARLREQEMRQRFAMQAAGAGAWDWHIASGDIVWSPENYVLHDFDPSLGAPSYADWESRVHPDDLALTNGTVRAVVEGNTSEFRAEYRVVHRDGRILWLLSLGRMQRDASGAAIRFSGINLDITARKQAEAQLREREHFLKRMTDMSPSIIVVFDLEEERCVFINRTVASVLGYSAEEIVAMRDNVAPMLMHPDDLARFPAHLKRVRMLRADETAEFEHRLRDRAGEWHWFHSRDAVFTRDDAGAVRQLIGTVIEITERKRAELALAGAAQRKDEFLAMLGHELRSPLAAIRHAVRIAEDTPEDREACRWAGEVVDRQSAQLARMVDDLLDVSRINRGRIDLRPESLDLRHVLDHAIAVARPLFEGKRHTFTAEIGEHLAVTGDAARLQQVFVNLLNNAVKYTPDGGHLALTAQHQDGELIVRITDTGVGMSADLVPHVFDLFRQAETTLDRAQGGLGIGLSVVKSLVEMHLGSVVVESEGEGRGTTVTVRLPRLLELSATPASRKPAPTSASLPRAVRVLLVDDHLDSARALARLLTRRGCNVKLAHDGPDGLAAARDFLPEICLLDLGLPGFDGFELARQIRAEPALPRPILIAISGYTQDADRAQSQAAGFDLHCAKPVDLDTIVETIRAKCLV